MNNLSNEQIHEIIAALLIVPTSKVNGVSFDKIAKGLGELLAYREAQGEPVGWKWRLVDVASGETSAWRVCLLPLSPGGGAGFETESIPLYTAPQLPAVPDDLLHMAASAIEDLLDHTDPATSYYAGVWAGVPGKLRAASMLQSASFRETDNSSTKHFRENAETSTNSPVITDGWIAAINRLLDSDGGRGCFDAMQCYDAHQEIEAMLAAAPKQEV